MNFLPGDKVVFLNAKMGGEVKRVIDKQQVMLLLDDGFELPVQASELVLVKRSEENKISAASANHEVILADKEATQDKLYLGFVIENTKGDNREVKAYLINTFRHELLYTVYNTTANLKGIARGILEPSRANLLANFPMDQLETWRNWQIQTLTYAERPAELSAAKTFKTKLRPATLFQARQMIPVLDKPGLNIELNENDNADAAPKINTAAVSAGEPRIEISPVSEIVDLHIDDLGDFASRLDAQSILQLQIQHFNNALEKAIAARMPAIIFIHGVGNGKLKNELRKILSFHKEVQRFEDADPKKFGYGATTVYLKSR